MSTSNHVVDEVVDVHTDVQGVVWLKLELLGHSEWSGWAPLNHFLAGPCYGDLRSKFPGKLPAVGSWA
ncbi:MAG TPA: hypothetical protein VLI92_05180 [Candidatus Saccharimonadales bacterium]|nr:hypothetical protein [Candidatus Saccharimonadales bacterium]